MNLVLLGFAILLVIYAINRFIMTAATRKLEDSDKLKIFEIFSKRNNYSTVFLVAFVLLFFAALQYLPGQSKQIISTYCAVFGVYLVYRFFSNYRKLKQIEMPSSYITSFLISYGIFAVGIGVVLVCSFWNWIW